jgi:alkylhydroperoxidase family enzyme
MTTSRLPAAVMESSALPPVYEEFAATVVRRGSVDPLITELVRLRCARYHDCRLCGSVRLVDAVSAGMSEEVVAALGDYERSDFDPRWKAALRLTDAVIVDPTSVDAELVAQLHEHFTEEQISELLFDIVKWSYQKALVALRLETPLVEGIGDLVIREDGTLVVTAREGLATAVA